MPLVRRCQNAEQQQVVELPVSESHRVPMERSGRVPTANSCAQTL
jgi:hypothetical protein